MHITYNNVPFHKHFIPQIADVIKPQSILVQIVYG